MWPDDGEGSSELTADRRKETTFVAMCESDHTFTLTLLPPNKTTKQHFLRFRPPPDVCQMQTLRQQPL